MKGREIDEKRAIQEYLKSGSFAIVKKVLNIGSKLYTGGKRWNSQHKIGTIIKINPKGKDQKKSSST